MIFPFFEPLSWLASAALLGLFVQILRVLSPGAYTKSRWTYAVLGLLLSPVFLRVSAEGFVLPTALAFTLAALFFGLRAIERERCLDALWFGGLAALAIFFRWDMAVLLALLAVALLLELARRRQWACLVGAVLIGGIVFGIACWLHPERVGPEWNEWSALNFFKNSFEWHGNTTSHLLPNVVFVLAPLTHPGFCFTLPALFLLFKKTDVHLYAKRILALSLLLFLLFVAGLPTQDIQWLFPAYVLLLLLLFPAWDRFFSYGLYFFPRLAYALITLTVACQLLYMGYLAGQL
ncbi:MAG: hypothetical protein ACKVU2_04255 [Saprospiraceae bacterium]